MKMPTTTARRKRRFRVSDQAHAAGDSRLQHHFDNAEQQFEASILGTWLFLVTEIMFFGGLFMAYILYRSKYPEAFHAGSHHLDVTLGTINTTVLIGSSFTMVCGVYNAQKGRIRELVLSLIATMILGSAFLVIKGVEYHHKWVDRLIPGPNFVWHGSEDPGNMELFFSIYFGMTGLHAFHMIIGVSLLGWIALQAIRGQYSSRWYTPVECSGLYWHFVDLVWIFLFPLLYLLGRS